MYQSERIANIIDPFHPENPLIRSFNLPISTVIGSNGKTICTKTLEYKVHWLVTGVSQFVTLYSKGQQLAL